MSRSEEWEDIVSLNVKVESGETFKVSLLYYDVKQKRYVDVFDVTPYLPVDELMRLSEKGRVKNKQHFRQVCRKMGIR